MTEERINISLTTDHETEAEDVSVIQKRFDIEYIFENRGRAGEWVIGFPVVMPSMATGGGSALSNFSVRGDGVGERIAPQPETFSRWTGPAVLHWCERFALRYLKQQMARGDRKAFQFGKESIQTRHNDGGEETEGERQVVGWYFWRQRFGKGQTRLRVGYTLAGGGMCQTNYVLRTARAWGDGRIDRLVVTVGVDVPARLKGFRAVLGTVSEVLGKGGLRPGKQNRADPTRVDDKKGRMTWEWRHFLADRDFVLINEPCGEG